MRATMQHENYGTIVYEESFWTGRKSLYLKGVSFQKVEKKRFEGRIGEEIVSAELVGSIKGKTGGKPVFCFFGAGGGIRPPVGFHPNGFQVLSPVCYTPKRR